MEKNYAWKDDVRNVIGIKRVVWPSVRVLSHYQPIGISSAVAKPNLSQCRSRRLNEKSRSIFWSKNAVFFFNLQTNVSQHYILSFMDWLATYFSKSTRRADEKMIQSSKIYCSKWPLHCSQHYWNALERSLRSKLSTKPKPWRAHSGS